MTILTAEIVTTLTTSYRRTREGFPNFKLCLCNLAIKIQTNSQTQLYYSLPQLRRDAGAGTRAPGAAATGAAAPSPRAPLRHRDHLQLSPSPDPGSAEFLSWR